MQKARLFLVLLLLALSPAPAAFAVEAAPPVEQLEDAPGAAELEARIIAPCCWTQTIDVHGNEVANDLRRQVRKRLRAGESVDQIEAWLVSQYGKRIIALPRSSALGPFAVGMVVVISFAGIGAAVMLRRWARRGRSQAGAKPQAASLAADPMDERLDAELRRIQDEST